MFRRVAGFGGPALQALKKTTGLVGLEVVPNGREVLIGIYQEILTTVKNSGIPQTAIYRQALEKLSSERLQILQEEQDVSKIEQRIGHGQIEEVIRSARKELGLIPKMAEWKPWEVPAGHQVQFIIEEVVDPKKAAPAAAAPGAPPPPGAPAAPAAPAAPKP
eukprot:jgi/Mesvir1/10499/Mv15049-RA.1